MLIAILALSLLSIFSFPPLFMSSGVVVKSIDSNSSAFREGLRQGDVITSINSKDVNNFEDYTLIASSLNFSDESKITISTKTNSFTFISDSPQGIIVSDIPKTNIKTGLDLRGGARALVAPEVPLSSAEIQDLIAISNERFNVYGISDVSIKQVSDLSGNNFMLIEIAGATPKDLDNLISQQGKFEAKIGNDTVFIGGNEDITYVCRNDAKCAGVESCNEFQDGYLCNYRFVIHLSQEAAERHAEITKNLKVNSSSGTSGRYLEKPIDFYVDDKLSTSLLISEDLKGRASTQIQIQGSGSGVDRNSAIEDAEASMKQMQTILITGSLPYKLEIVKLDTISPILGEKFNYLLLLTGLASLLAVSIIVFIRYRNIKLSLAVLFTSFSEIIIILGIASLIKWNLDLPSIVGILVTIGTGVDQQIVILDEAKSKREETIREKMKGG